MSAWSDDGYSGPLREISWTDDPFNEVRKCVMCGRKFCDDQGRDICAECAEDCGDML